MQHNREVMCVSSVSFSLNWWLTSSTNYNLIPTELQQSIDKITSRWIECSALLCSCYHMKNEDFQRHFASSTSAKRSCWLNLKLIRNLQSFLFCVIFRRSVQFISVSWTTEGGFSVGFATNQGNLRSIRKVAWVVWGLNFSSSALVAMQETESISFHTDYATNTSVCLTFPFFNA